MALKRKQSVTYVTDTGKELEVNEMTDSHLMNAIAHHLKQINALESFGTTEVPTYTAKRIKNLKETVSVLYDELATRDPDVEDVGNFKNNTQRWRDDDY